MVHPLLSWGCTICVMDFKILSQGSDDTFYMVTGHSRGYSGIQWGYSDPAHPKQMLSGNIVYSIWDQACKGRILENYSFGKRPTSSLGFLGFLLFVSINVGFGKWW